MMTKSLQRATVILAGAAALASGCGDGGSRETSARDTPPQGTAREPVSLARDGGEIFTYRPAAYGGGPSVDAGSLEATARRVKARAVALKLRLDAEVRGRALVVTCVACSTSPPAETGRLRDLRHSLGPGDITQSCCHQGRIAVLEYRLQIISDVLVGLKI